MTKKLRELYRIDQLPIFQNRMYDSEAEARSCPSGDVCLVEDFETGLVHNALFLSASGLRAHSPDEAMRVLPDGSTVYVMNSNYLEEIRRMSNNRFSYTAVDHE